MNKKAITKQQEILSSVTYPMTFDKNGIGGALADAFNAGYEGRKGGIYRFKRNSPAHVFYNAGKKCKKLTNPKQSK